VKTPFFKAAMQNEVFHGAGYSEKLYFGYMKKLVFIIICIAGLSACNNDAGKTATADSLAAHPDTTAQAVFVRQNIYSLPASDPIILAYKKGLAVMQLRDKADPTSWSYQAAIHGTTSIIKKPAWSTCQHGTFFFLSWHRMFLYYFERIVRKASGYPKFALPYWNYSDDPSQAALPLVFR